MANASGDAVVVTIALRRLLGRCNFELVRTSWVCGPWAVCGRWAVECELDKHHAIL